MAEDSPAGSRLHPAEQQLTAATDRLQRVRGDLRRAGETLQQLRQSGASYQELRQAEDAYRAAQREEAYAGASYEKAQDAYQSAADRSAWINQARTLAGRVGGMEPPPHPMPKWAAAAEFRPVPVGKSAAGRGGASRLIPDSKTLLPAGYVRTQKMWEQAWRGAQLARELQALRAQAVQEGNAKTFDAALPHVAGLQDADMRALPYQSGTLLPWSPVGHVFGTAESFGGGLAGNAKMLADRAIKAVGQPGMSAQEYQDTWQETMNARQRLSQGLLGDDYVQGPYWHWRKHYESAPSLEARPWLTPKGLRSHNVYDMVMDDKIAFDGAPALQWLTANLGAATTDLIPFFGGASRVGKMAMHGGARPMARAAVAGQRLVNNTLGRSGAVRRVALPLAQDAAATAAVQHMALPPLLGALMPEEYGERLQLQDSVIGPLMSPR